ncbi:aminotransferase class IV [Actinacidiphila acididurans]|uniref:Aminotransferase class IV n=1 Tax=Actinacidiphila acididurans TaxID=2784346 RepID=A0ABS2TWD1_9ACTN|nr:aminotransferase class IV [Actinacidiphila acididurans]MBM9507097.1 aminotransferase class IV [Actinacidiphila acididurans]
MTDEPLIEVDGTPATAQSLAPALSGYGHFTAMQVRGGRVRGLAFHLRRLDEATRELFGAGLDGDLVRDRIRHALAARGSADASVRVNVYQPAEGPGRPVTVVTVREPGEMPQGPQRVKSVPYLRPAAHLKHVGGFGQAYWGRRVAADGYGEALLVGPGGEIAEGAITNIGFIDGGTIVWPDAPHLSGITQQILHAALTAAGISQEPRHILLPDVPTYRGAFLTNSRGIARVAEIDGVPLPTDGPLLARVATLYEAAPWDAI